MVVMFGAAVALLLIAPCVGALQLPPSVSSLPIASVLDSILHTLSHHRSAVLQAPPGAGKSHTAHISPPVTPHSPHMSSALILPGARKTTRLTPPTLPHMSHFPFFCIHERRFCLLLFRGAGKTTAVPLALLEEDPAWLAGRSILVLEPRRVAARGASCFLETHSSHMPHTDSPHLSVEIRRFFSPRGLQKETPPHDARFEKKKYLTSYVATHIFPISH